MPENQISASTLRGLYVRATLRQRYSVAKARIDNPDHGPNRVVAAIAALEGFTRAVAVKAELESGTPLELAYEKLRWTKPLELLESYVLPALHTTPAEVFDPAMWKLLPEAIEFRNLLVHEATYLHGGTCEQLVDAAVHVLERIAQLTGAIAV